MIEPTDKGGMYETGEQFTVTENMSDLQVRVMEPSRNPRPYQHLSAPFKTAEDCFNIDQADQYQEGYEIGSVSWSDSDVFHIKLEKGQRSTKPGGYQIPIGGIISPKGPQKGPKKSLSTPNKGKLYICEYCNKTFTNHSTRWEHRLTHTGQYPHRCTCCQPSKGFVRKRELIAHQTGLPQSRIKLNRRHDIVEYE